MIGKKKPGDFLDILFTVWIAGQWTGQYLECFERFNPEISKVSADSIDHALVLQYYAMRNLVLSKVPVRKKACKLSKK